MMDDEPVALPEMRTGILNDDDVGALFRDLEALVVLDEVIVKDGPGLVDQSEGITLERAKELLLCRAVRGVQIRYRHDGVCWWDTLMCVPEGVRLVRIRHEFGDM